MAELERMLSQLGGELDWPDTPELVPGVRARLAGTPPQRVRRPRFGGLRRSLALALVLAVILAAAAAAAIPAVRDTVLEWFGLQGATVERVATLPTPPPERPLELGRRTTLPDARERLAFEPLLPAGLGEPDGVYIRRRVSGGELSLAYRPRPGLARARSTRLGLLVSEFRGDLHPDYVGKIVGPATVAQSLTVDGGRAVWVAGAPHFFFYRTPDGRVMESELRLAQNVLLVERGELLVRLEGAFSRERAIRLARSLRVLRDPRRGGGAG
jgi:hypothetical protein